MNVSGSEALAISTPGNEKASGGSTWDGSDRLLTPALVDHRRDCTHLGIPIPFVLHLDHKAESLEFCKARVRRGEGFNARPRTARTYGGTSSWGSL
jgi:hypothetical protein